MRVIRLANLSFCSLEFPFLTFVYRLHRATVLPDWTDASLAAEQVSKQPCRRRSDRGRASSAENAE
jgi:hypothetical protein